MPHMLAQEHMGFVDALRYGTARTEVTLAAAVTAIGSTKAILVATLAGDGVWTIGANLTIPANITLWIPPGVTVSRGAGITLTIAGQLVSFSSGWETGSGTTVRTFAENVYTEFTRLVPYLGVQVPFEGNCFIAGATGARQIILNNRIAGGPATNNAAIQFLMPPFVPGADNWEMGVNDTSHYWYVARPGGAGRLVVAEAGLGVSNGSVPNTPTHVLQMAVDDAFKGTTLWSIPSDARLKTVLGDFTDGLATLQALPQSVRFTWNGKGGTVDDGLEHYGRIAQDVQAVAPYLIREYQDKLEPTDAAPTTLLSANDSPLIEVLINAVKELAARVEGLEAALATTRRASTADETEEPPRTSRRRKD